MEISLSQVAFLSGDVGILNLQLLEVLGVELIVLSLLSDSQVGVFLRLLVKVVSVGESNFLNFLLWLSDDFGLLLTSLSAWLLSLLSAFGTFDGLLVITPVALSVTTLLVVLSVRVGLFALEEGKAIVVLALIAVLLVAGSALSLSSALLVHFGVDVALGAGSHGAVTATATVAASSSAFAIATATAASAFASATASSAATFGVAARPVTSATATASTLGLSGVSGGLVLSIILTLRSVLSFGLWLLDDNFLGLLGGSLSLNGLCARRLLIFNCKC